jgi:uncharacterized membrane protein
MTTGFYLKLYLATLLAFFLIDMLWLGLVARWFYQKHLGSLLAPTTNWLAALIFYLLFIAGILTFVVVPSLTSGSLGRVALMGAFFGLITYATYDMTNLATLKDWPVLVTVIDLLWGMSLTTLVSCISYLVGRGMIGG